MSDQVIVRDSQQDMELLYKQFPHLRRNSKLNQTRVGAFGPAPLDPSGRLPFEPEIEGDDYITPPKQSSYRGSRPRVEEGTPAAVVRREYYSHAELALKNKPRIFHPEVLKQVDKSHVNFDMGPISGPPPRQEDYFTQNEEGKKMIAQYGMPKAPTPKATPMEQHMVHQAPSLPATNFSPAPPPDPSVLPPTEKPWDPSSADIVKVLGWNETNMKLMTEVSKRIGQCGELLTKINSAHQAVDVDELMRALYYMDNTQFRQIFADIFQAQLTKYMNLSAEIQSYLNGTAVIDTDQEEPSDTNTVDTVSASEGNVTVVSATGDSSQNTSDQSLSSGSAEVTLNAGQSIVDPSQVTG